MRNDGRITGVQQAYERLRLLAPYEPRAASLLALLGPEPLPPPETDTAPQLPLYVRAPHLLRVKLVCRRPLSRVLAVFAADDRPRTVAEIAEATGLNAADVRTVLINSGRFVRDGIDGTTWLPTLRRPTSLPLQGGSHVGAIEEEKRVDHHQP